MENYIVKRIDMTTAKEYICKNHYTKGCHNAPNPCYGLFDKDTLIGVLMFAQPCSENVRSSIWGKEYKNRVIELHRLHILDITPRNTESWFISKCIKLLSIDKPEVRGIISFADSTEGHNGTIYQASNFYYIGKTGKAIFYKDTTGRLRHPRQNSINISKEDALSKGWSIVKRGAKNRYLYIFGRNKSERKELIRSCKYDVLHSKWCKDCGR
ncbi:MAG: hypothetical protein GX265_05200, partial [Mollicutes bacterium]|nr:hypothetical protein [Mollicutes bacterium]